MESEGIFSEEQLQRSIEAGQWYESEGESGSDDYEEGDENLKQLPQQEQVVSRARRAPRTSGPRD